MRRGVFEGAFPIGQDLATCFRQARAAGFEGVELSLASADPLAPEAVNETTPGIRDIERSIGLDVPRRGGLRLTSSAADIRAIRRQAEDTGLAIPSVSTMQLFYYPLSSHIIAVRDRGVSIVRKMIEATAELGGDLVLVVPGMVTRDVPYEDVWKRSVETLGEIVPFAEQAGVTLAIENVWNKFLLSPLEFGAYVDGFRSPYVGAYFDVANVLRYGNPEQWIRYLGQRIKRVHLKDYRLDVDDIRGFTYLRQGDVPWPAVMEALDEIAYTGWAVLEVSPYRVHPEQVLVDSARALDCLLPCNQLPLRGELGSCEQ